MQTTSPPAHVESPGPLPAEAQRALEHYAQPDATKGAASLRFIDCCKGVLKNGYVLSAVIVRFKATGNAPVLQNTYAKITAGQKFHAVIKYLRGQLGYSPSDSLVSLHSFQAAIKARELISMTVPLH